MVLFCNFKTLKMNFGKNDFLFKTERKIKCSLNNLPITDGGRWELKNEHNNYDL